MPLDFKNGSSAPEKSFFINFGPTCFFSFLSFLSRSFNSSVILLSPQRRFVHSPARYFFLSPTGLSRFVNDIVSVVAIADDQKVHSPYLDLVLSCTNAKSALLGHGNWYQGMEWADEACCARLWGGGGSESRQRGQKDDCAE